MAVLAADIADNALKLFQRIIERLITGFERLHNRFQFAQGVFETGGFGNFAGLLRHGR
jgi:hypothetical protein